MTLPTIVLPKEVVGETGLVPVDDRVERIENVCNLVLSIYRQVQDIREIYLHNYNRGIKFVEIGPYDAPFDYKLNQLNGSVTQLRSIFEESP